ncbi:MAG TPA: UDP-N-acetylmuramoyl-tripeptide--D-alanyl-D-alanine ligase [Burkholderiales bacterium]|nr:UDP-N-acetylmuramoyl-tripeptide--D-alanyl-D-alanine ligase [Burkholderiales bacterium]
MMHLGEAARAVNGRSAGGDPLFSGVSTDTRSLRDGELFVALRGERFDGHAFLGAAREKGAVAAMIDHRYDAEFPMPVLVVDDTKLGLGALARHWRGRFSPALVAVAGSNGKTTVKEMLAAILRAHAGEEQVLSTAGNLNNEIGVPLTLLRLRAAHRWCAIELGMNHKGEIAYLAGLAQPLVALVNNAQREHLEFMRSVEEVAAENASVYAALPADGVAVVNADDPQAAFFRKAAGARRVVDFGLDAAASVTGTATLDPLGSEVEVRTATGHARATLAIPGLHNVRNALAAAACAYAAGVDLKSIGEGLTRFRPYTGRLQVKQAKSGATVIDDSYNANPDSVRAAIDVLAQCPGPTALVLGDMGEVGEQGPAFHREVGAYARSKKITAVYALGEATRETVRAFGAGARHFDGVESLVESLQGTTILVKGSRFMRMERVVSALTGHGAPGGH